MAGRIQREEIRGKRNEVRMFVDEGEAGALHWQSRPDGPS